MIGEPREFSSAISGKSGFPRNGDDCLDIEEGLKIDGTDGSCQLKLFDEAIEIFTRTRS
jgi:hypothetical protein